MSLTRCTWTWIRGCAYVRNTHGHHSKTDRRVAFRSQRTHEETQTLSAHHPPFSRSRLSNIWPLKGPSFTSSGSLCTCFRHERWDQYSVRRHKRGRTTKCVFFRERFSYVYVFLCANSQRVAATLKTSIPLQWCVQTFVKHHVCVCCFLFHVHPSILPPHDPSLVFPPAYMLLKRLNN